VGSSKTNYDWINHHKTSVEFLTYVLLMEKNTSEQNFAPP
jgi:hypothetical protein